LKSGRSGWRGKSCNSLLHGVCQQEVEEPLVVPEHMVAEPGQGRVVVR